MKHLFTSSFNHRLISRFGMIFASTFVCFVLAFEALLWRVDENMSYSAVIERQMRTAELYSPRYFNVENDFKKRYLQRNPARIVALGTSRIFQVGRTDLNTKDFFNAGSSASTSKDIDGMLDIMNGLNQDQLPDVLLVGIDPWLFNPGYPANRDGFKKRLVAYPPVRLLYRPVKFIRNRMAAYSLLINEDKDILPHFVAPAPGIGLNAKIFGAGFGADGSYHYPPETEAEEVRSLADWQENLRGDSYRFAGADHLYKPALEKFSRLLALCQKNGVEVIGFLMPFRPDFYTAMTSTQPHAEYFQAFRIAIPELLQRYNYRCYDWSDPTQFGLTPQDFRDKMHVRHYVYARLFKGLSLDPEREVGRSFPRGSLGLTSVRSGGR